MQRRTRNEWRADVEEWVRGGQTCREYAESVGLNPKSLSWWKWNLTKQGEVFAGPEMSAETGDVRFVEVTGTEALIADEAPTRLEVVWGDAVVRVPDDFESETLSRVLDTLEARS